jgi:hypothetical protein
MGFNSVFKGLINEMRIYPKEHITDTVYSKILNHVASLFSFVTPMFQPHRLVGNVTDVEPRLTFIKIKNPQLNS